MEQVQGCDAIGNSLLTLYIFYTVGTINIQIKVLVKYYF